MLLNFLNETMRGARRSFTTLDLESCKRKLSADDVETDFNLTLADSQRENMPNGFDAINRLLVLKE